MSIAGRRRKAAPKHAAPTGDAPSSAKPRKRDNTTFMLIAILVVTSGFVAGTTASFTASTRNGGNTFTVGAIFSPTAPAGTFSNATASFSWTNVDSVTYPVNSGVGYRVLRGSSALGPTDTAGSAPNCTSALRSRVSNHKRS